MQSPSPSQGAETVALNALAFLAESPEELDRFLALSGIGPADLRARLGDRDLLAGVLDHLLANEPLLLAFCESQGLKANEIQRIRATLDNHP